MVPNSLSQPWPLLRHGTVFSTDAFNQFLLVSRVAASVMATTPKLDARTVHLQLCLERRHPFRKRACPCPCRARPPTPRAEPALPCSSAVAGLALPLSLLPTKRAGKSREVELRENCRMNSFQRPQSGGAQAGGGAGYLGRLLLCLARVSIGSERAAAAAPVSALLAAGGGGDAKELTRPLRSGAFSEPGSRPWHHHVTP